MHKISYKRLLELVITKASLNLRSETSVNYLSYGWWVIEPLLHMVVYYFVFKILLQRGGDDYVVFLMTGLIPWLWFAKSVSHAQGSILGAKRLMGQVYLPKIFFPLTGLFQDAIKQMVVFTILIGFLLCVGLVPSFIWLGLIPIIFLQFLFIIAISLLAALIVPFIRDFSLIIPTVLQFLMFCSGVFYRYESIPEHIQRYFFINPMAVFLRAYRDIFISDMFLPFNLFLYVSILTLGLLYLAILLFKKLDFLLPRVVL
ncbi:TPA: ABC transporter permease [Mannheimia haemolytica]